jgi:hypothetical protein
MVKRRRERRRARMKMQAPRAERPSQTTRTVNVPLPSSTSLHEPRKNTPALEIWAGESNLRMADYGVGQCVYVSEWWDAEAVHTQQRQHLKHVALVEKVVVSSAGGSNGASKRKAGGAGRGKSPAVHPTSSKVTLRYFYRPNQTFHAPSHAFYEKVRAIEVPLSLCHWRLSASSSAPLPLH